MNKLLTIKEGKNRTLQNSKNLKNKVRNEGECHDILDLIAGKIWLVEGLIL